MKNLAKALNLAANLREDSYDKETNLYNLSLYEACDKAIKIGGFDKIDVFLLFVLLTNSWNEILYWAEDTIARGEKE